MAITQLWQQRQAQQDAQRDFFQGAAWCRVRGADECQRDTIKNLTRSVHGISSLSRLNLRWRWTAHRKKWIVIEFWRHADAREAIAAEFSAKIVDIRESLAEIQVAWKTVNNFHCRLPRWLQRQNAGVFHSTTRLRPRMNNFFVCGK